MLCYGFRHQVGSGTKLVYECSKTVPIIQSCVSYHGTYAESLCKRRMSLFLSIFASVQLIDLLGVILRKTVVGCDRALDNL